MINYQTITIDLQPDYREPVVQMYLSERDVGRPIQVNVLMQGQPYSFTAGTTVHIDLRKPSGHVVQVNGNYAVGSNVVLFNVVEQMAAEPGMCLTELSIVGDGQDPIGSKNWLTKVELSPLHAGDPSETWIEDLDELVQDAMEGHIDATLSIPGDAADAAAVGEELADLKSALDEFNGGSINLLNPADFQQGKYIVDGGGLSDNANLTASGFFTVSPNTSYYMYRSDTYRVRVAYYTIPDASGYISMDSAISATTPSFTTPGTAKYARISTNKTMILDMGVYATDIRYYIPYKIMLSSDVSIKYQLDPTLTDGGKASPADVVGELKKYVIIPEKCVKYGDSGMIVNERLDTDTGKVTTNASNQTRTDFIPVGVGDYVQTCAIRDILLYNDQFEYLGYINLWSSSGTVSPPSSYSGNYRSNLTQIEAINNVNPSYMRCWGRYDQYPPAVTVLTSDPYKVLNLGDSIFGNNEKPWDLGTYIQNITGLKDANCGYGGTTARVISSGNMSPLGLPSIVDCIVAEDFSNLQTPAYWAGKSEYMYSVPTLLFSMIDFSKLEIITIAYGTNDYNSNTPIDNENNWLDTSTYKGGLRYAVENLQTKYPDITLIMLSPIYRYWSDSSDYSTVDRDSDGRTNSLGLKLIDYVTAMKEVADEYHLPYFDNYDNIGLNRYTAPTWLRDGTHLNRGIGVDKMGHIVAKEVGEIY